VAVVLGHEPVAVLPALFVSQVDGGLYAGRELRGPSLQADGSMRLYRSVPNMMKVGTALVQVCRAGECVRWIGPTYPLRMLRSTAALQNRPYVLLDPTSGDYCAVETLSGLRVVTKEEMVRTFSPRMIGMNGDVALPLDGKYAFFFEDGLLEHGLAAPGGGGGGDDAPITNATVIPVIGMARQRYVPQLPVCPPAHVLPSSYRAENRTMEVVGAAVVFTGKVKQHGRVLMACEQQIWNTPITFRA
jgi:hypothetical protein